MLCEAPGCQHCECQMANKQEISIKESRLLPFAAEDKLAASSDAAPKHLKRSRRCAESTGDEDEVLNGAVPDHEEPAAKRVAAGASVEVN